MVVSPVTGVSLVTGVATGVAAGVTSSVSVRRESVAYAHVIILIYSIPCMSICQAFVGGFLISYYKILYGSHDI